uniref:Odorant receptor n=1 Tax=Culicoides sonorensis TaxID=179676 RepID=A0A336LKL9_CULSO
MLNFLRIKLKRLFDQEIDGNTYRKIQAFHMRIDNLCTVLGLNLLRDDFKPDIRTVISVFLASITFFFFIFTQVFYYKQGKYLEAFLVFTYIGIDIQSLAKLYFSYTNKRLLYDMGQKLIQIHGKYQTDVERRKILNICYNRCDKIFKVFTFLYINAFIGLLSFPLLIYIFDHRNVTMFIQLTLPGFTSGSKMAYTVNMIYQFVVMCYATMGLMAVDIMFMCVTAHYVCLCDLFEVSLKEISRELRYDGDSDYKKRIKFMMRNIILEHEYMMIFLNDQDDLYTNICFFEIFATNFTCVALLFVETFKFWFPGYSIGLAAFIQFLLFCAVGTVIEIANEKTVTAIYEIPWYCFSKERALEFLIMFKKAQNPNYLSIGGLAPLTVATAKEIINKMYSYYMMFLSFIDEKAVEKLLNDA